MNEEFIALTSSIRSISFIIPDTPLFQTLAENFYQKVILKIIYKNL